jgi:hypothetical protein
MTEPVSDIKIGLRIWKYLGIAKETWDQIAAAPQQIVDLQKRIADLEARLQRCPGEGCPHCGALAFRIQKSEPAQNEFRNLGARQYHWLCGDCGYTDVRMDYPGTTPTRR